jgi:GDP-L-fucose synthase
MNKNSKIYIAGHTGLVGSSILRNLKSKGYSNFVFTAYPEFDLTDQSKTAAFFEREKPEYVFLAAAKVGGIVANNTYRADFIYQNLQIQNNIIHQSYLHGVKKLLFLGSSCIYPKSCPQPMKEEYLLTGVLEYTNEPYAIAKIAGIKMIESYNIQYGTNYISVMPTNLYGPNDNFDLEKSHVLPAMIRKMHLGKCLMENNFAGLRQDLAKRPIEGIADKFTDEDIISVLSLHNINKDYVKLWGSGNPRREFLHADDLAKACIYLMENVDNKDILRSVYQINNNSNTLHQEIRNTHINIGTGIDISIKDLAFIIKNITGYKGEILWDTTKPDGTFQKLLDVSMLNNLGWVPTIVFEQGIRDVYAEYLASQKI